MDLEHTLDIQRNVHWTLNIFLRSCELESRGLQRSGRWYT